MAKHKQRKKAAREESLRQTEEERRKKADDELQQIIDDPQASRADKIAAIKTQAQLHGLLKDGGPTETPQRAKELSEARKRAVRLIALWWSSPEGQAAQRAIEAEDAEQARQKRPAKAQKKPEDAARTPETIGEPPAETSVAPLDKEDATAGT